MKQQNNKLTKPQNNKIMKTIKDASKNQCTTMRNNEKHNPIVKALTDPSLQTLPIYITRHFSPPTSHPIILTNHPTTPTHKITVSLLAIHSKPATVIMCSQTVYSYFCGHTSKCSVISCSKSRCNLTHFYEDRSSRCSSCSRADASGKGKGSARRW